MVDLRYHITSLVAVFLALGIGMIIGSTVVGSEGLVMEQQVLIDRLEDDFYRLRQQNSDYKEKVAQLENINLDYHLFMENIYPLVVKDKLKEQQLLVIKTGDFPELDRLKEGLEAAGAMVKTVIDINREREGYGQIAAANGKTENTWVNISKSVVNSFLDPLDDNILTTLVDEGFLNITGSIDYIPDAVILAGGTTAGKPNLVQQIDRSFVEFWRDRDIPVFGVEFVEADASYIQDYRSFGISSVDNVDTVVGRLALVFVMSGRDGTFGIKQTAQAVIPSLLEN